MKPWLRWGIIAVVLAAVVVIVLSGKKGEEITELTKSAKADNSDCVSCTDPTCSTAAEFAQVQYDQDHEPSSAIRFIELGSSTCRSCKQMKAVLGELEEHYPHRLVVESYDVKEDPDIARLYQIRVIPTQVIIDTSGKEIYRHEGYFPLEEIELLLAETGIAVDG